MLLQGANIKNELVTTEFDQKDAFIKKTFNEVGTVDEFYDWLNGPFYRVLYTNLTTTGTDHDPFNGRLLGTDYLVGG